MTKCTIYDFQYPTTSNLAEAGTLKQKKWTVHSLYRPFSTVCISTYTYFQKVLRCTKHPHKKLYSHSMLPCKIILHIVCSQSYAFLSLIGYLSHVVFKFSYQSKMVSDYKSFGEDVTKNSSGHFYHSLVVLAYFRRKP